MWETSWVNFTMDLATIPKTDTKKKKPADEHIAPEDEEAQLRAQYGL